jgi:hypothetical protein
MPRKDCFTLVVIIILITVFIFLFVFLSLSPETIIDLSQKLQGL